MAEFRLTLMEGVHLVGVAATQIVLGFALDYFPVQRRKILSVTIGVLSTLLLCGPSIIYLLLLTVSSSLLIWILQRYKYFYFTIFIWAFAALSHYRLTQTNTFAHGVLMQIVLRIVSVAAEMSNKKECVCSKFLSNEALQALIAKTEKSNLRVVTESTESSSAGETEQGQKNPPVEGSPDTPVDVHCDFCCQPKSPVDIMAFFWCHVGLFLTPTIRFKTFVHYCTARFICSAEERRNEVSKLLQHLLVVIPAGLALSKLIKLDACREESFVMETTFLYRMAFFIGAFTLFRLRLYVGLLIGECGAIACGFGYYPPEYGCQPYTGPTKKKASGSSESSVDSDVYPFRTVLSSRPSVELSTSMKVFVRHWNQTVQGWLLMCVYKRVRLDPITNMFFTFFVSGVWHNLHLGAWLLFIHSVLYIGFVEVHFPQPVGKIQTFLFWCLQVVMFSYWFASYIALYPTYILSSYQSLYFFGHICVFAFIGIAHFLKKKKRPVKEN